MRAVPVFMYHHINWHAGDLVTLTPEDFENHLRVLQRKKTRTVFLDEMVDYLGGTKSLSGPAVALTFDDGHLDNWVYAFPLLRKYGARATIFVITSWMADGEKRNQWDLQDRTFLSLPPIPTHKEAKETGAGLRWEEARAMEESGLVDIQSHTHFHRDYFTGEERSRRLDPQKREPLVADLARSKELIEERLSKKCRFLCWPWGKYDPEAIELARGLGFEALATTEKGVNFPGSNAAQIKRVVAKSGDPGWFSVRIRIYSHRTIGRLYSKLHGKI